MRIVLHTSFPFNMLTEVFVFLLPRNLITKRFYDICPSNILAYATFDLQDLFANSFVESYSYVIYVVILRVITYNIVQFSRV